MWGRLIGCAGIALIVAPQAHAQETSSTGGETALPPITVTAPSPIRRAPARPAPRVPAQPAPTPGAPAAPTPAPEPSAGNLPILPDQFATVTVVPNEELRPAPTTGTLGDLLFSKT